MEIKGYTLHGDYYLADEAIAYTTWKKACEMKEEITLPNGKKVIAHILSKEELETIPLKERKTDFKYWTSTRCDVNDSDDFEYEAWSIECYHGLFNIDNIQNVYSGVFIRLGFKNPF